MSRQYEQSDNRIHLLHSDERLGRGKALNRAIHESKGKIVCYYDVDLATDMQHLPQLIDAIREGADIATGSRLMPGSDIVRYRGSRDSESYPIIFWSGFFWAAESTITSAGLKHSIKNISSRYFPPYAQTTGSGIPRFLSAPSVTDTRVHEFPVRWRAGKGTTVKIKDVFEMGSSILRLWWQIHVSKN